MASLVTIYMEESRCPNCNNSKSSSEKYCDGCLKNTDMSFMNILYTGIALSVILATILNWIFPDDFTWWEKFSGLLFISVAIVKISSSRK